MEEENVQHGTITIKLFDKDGNVTHEETVENLITDAGDLYQATRIAAGVNSNAVSQPSLVTGMKLGTGTTAATKNGTAAALITYLTGSNKTLDAGYPQLANLGASLGVNVVYRCTWDAGVATSATINEVVIVTDAAANATSSAANTIARGVFGTTINKAGTEALEVTWNHKQLGA
jgi:hypothetical protein